MLQLLFMSAARIGAFQNLTSVVNKCLLKFIQADMSSYSAQLSMFYATLTLLMPYISIVLLHSTLVAQQE